MLAHSLTTCGGYKTLVRREAEFLVRTLCKEIINRGGQQFHQYQQGEQLPISAQPIELTKENNI